MSVNQVSRRYAQAWIGAAREKSAMASLGNDLAVLKDIISKNADFTAFLKSPVLSEAEQKAVMDAVSKKAKLDSITVNFLSLLVSKRRLSVLEGILDAASNMLAEEAGEVKAVVTSASALSSGEVKDITSALSKRFGRDVQVDVQVNPEIIGGLVIRVGSTLIDDSVKTKLGRLQRELQAGAAA